MTAKKTVKIGVLALQGDVLEHLTMMDEVFEKRNINSKTILIKRPEQLEKLDGLIIPGGESTVMSRLSSERRFGEELVNKIRERVKKGMALFGTCAGCILLSKSSTDRVVSDFSQEILELMDIKVIRNKYGRQQDSFERSLVISVFGTEPFPGVFIRAPAIVSAGKSVEVLSRNSEEIFAAKQDKMLAVTFHPELTDDTRFHEYFLELAMS